MPSPFPGMDPFLEGQRWLGFHDEFTLGIRAALVPQVRPRYVVEVEERVYLERAAGERFDRIRPDVTVEERGGEPEPAARGTSAAVAVTIEPVPLPLPIPEQEREIFLTLRERETSRIVTVIEVLSPTNKRAGSDGQREYLEKRNNVLLSATHLVELDLLRGGERLPTLKPLPLGDYYAFVCRVGQRPMADVYPWPLRHSLPTIPIPLAESDPDVLLDLQTVFAAAYDRGGYDYALDYQAPVEPPLDEADAAWVREMLAEKDGKDAQSG